MRLRRISARLLGARPRLDDESGMALVMALGITLVLAIALTTVITFSAAGARDSHRVNAGQKAYALAEAGVNNALSVLYATYPDRRRRLIPARTACSIRRRRRPAFPGRRPAVACCSASSPFMSTPDASRPNETVTWWGRIRTVPGRDALWVISSTGSVPNPTGPGAAPVTRTVHAKVPVIIGPPEPVPPGVLNWLYSTTDATALQSVAITLAILHARQPA